MAKNIIIVTGFGPFKGHEDRNASWEAVQLLPETFSFRNSSYEIRKYEVPVTYEAVDNVIPLIWDQKPQLVIHVGVHGSIDTINLEQCSYTSGYFKEDFAQRCLPCDKINLSGKAASDVECKMLHTNLNVEQIVQELNVQTNIKCLCSTEVGNYLCGYIYLKSLDINPDRSLFIHVPVVNKPYSSEETKAAIYNVIGKCLEQLYS